MTDPPDAAVLRLRGDNTVSNMVLTRGWSQKLSHLPIIYGVSTLWAAERVRQRLVEIVKEGTTVMVADPLTKLSGGDVLFRRRILSRA